MCLDLYLACISYNCVVMSHAYRTVSPDLPPPSLGVFHLHALHMHDGLAQTYFSLFCDIRYLLAQKYSIHTFRFVRNHYLPRHKNIHHQYHKLKIKIGCPELSHNVTPLKIRVYLVYSLNYGVSRFAEDEVLRFSHLSENKPNNSHTKQFPPSQFSLFPCESNGSHRTRFSLSPIIRMHNGII